MDVFFNIIYNMISISIELNLHYSFKFWFFMYVGIVTQSIWILIHTVLTTMLTFCNGHISILHVDMIKAVYVQVDGKWRLQLDYDTIEAAISVGKLLLQFPLSII